MFTNHKNLTEYHNVMVIDKGVYKGVRAIDDNYVKKIILKNKESVHLLMDPVTGRPSALFVKLTDKYNFTVYYYGPGNDILDVLYVKVGLYRLHWVCTIAEFFSNGCDSVVWRES